ncbi:ralA-binding protein 1 isoform X1 [Drosophila sulfurigaster albostrigata]|uniref:ralA-binding protein 1 isoform X1 n=1 Tax=Drosophila sulfurigaster albostrigata TaxID=89887 RepID=UPI002D21CCFC|nr:ralA-binding protein 1 isoform X1 [Drosophila sulfurigaster albostrigata]
MDFDSPEEKEFPGLYASEAVDAKSKKSKEESDYSEGDHEKHSKKDLIGRRKDKKEKGKDRGYAALEGESSPEEELDTKSPSKSKKSKTFKFTSSKSKEKREKSRDKEKEPKATEDEPVQKVKDKDKDKDKDKERQHEEKENKKKDKERKEKDKKDKSDKKDKKDKKSKQTQLEDAAGVEEVLALGYPIFGVSVSLATERSRCHDGIDLPLVVRDCIDFLQQKQSLKCEQIYKVEPIKTRLLHYKRLYNNREHDATVDELNIPTACSLLKLFFRELPEPVLTTDLVARFEEVASHPKVTEQQAELQQLLEQLPKCNRTLLAWMMLHFDAVIQQERYNKLNAQSLAMLLSPTLQMSHRLMVALLCHCTNLFPDVKLIKYVPPLTSTSPGLPDKPEDIQLELRKQDSLLSQIHSEMNAGFISKKREEQLWEVQRIITQLKRKLRSCEKKQERSIDELDSSTSAQTPAQPAPPPQIDTVSEDTTDSKPAPPTHITPAEEQPEEPSFSESSEIDYTIDKQTGYLLLPKTSAQRDELLRLQIEYDELMNWQNELKTRILAERNEVFRLKQLCEQEMLKPSVVGATSQEQLPGDGDYERIIEHYTRENALLEHKKQMLGMELKEERRACIALQVELRMQQF